MRGRTAKSHLGNIAAMPSKPSPYRPTAGAVDLHIGARLSGRRTMLGLSVEALALHSRVDPVAYREYEAGTERIPAAALLEVCQVLRVPVRFVFDNYEAGADAAKEWAYHPAVPSIS